MDDQQFGVGLAGGHPLAYLITFTCYGTHLHGSGKGSVDRLHNSFESPPLPPDQEREQRMRSGLSQEPYNLDRSRRGLTLQAIREVCQAKEWDLIAAHVRSTHVHTVVAAGTHPRYVRAAMKRRASGLITSRAREEVGRKRWTEGGSNRYLWKLDQAVAAVEYVVRGQGDPMELYEKPGWYWQYM